MAELRDFLGIHYGQSIVVCGLGSSISSFHNPERFCTIGVNDIGRAFTPTYLFVMDPARNFGPERFKFIQNTDASWVFTDKELPLAHANAVKFPIRMSRMPKFDDPTALYMIGNPPTSPFLALCLAAHLGAKAIGLVGVDFTDGHFFSPDGPHKLAQKVDLINKRFYRLGSALLDRGVKVFNLSAQSRLNAFPRLSADDFYAVQTSRRSRSWARPARRVCFISASPINGKVARMARLINSQTDLVCRLMSPRSPDISVGSSTEVEQDVLAKATVKIDCDKVDIPSVSAAAFLQSWNDRVKPLLFGRPRSFHTRESRRALSLSVIVSQETRTENEVLATLRSLWRDLLPTDDMIVLGSAPAASGAPGTLPEFKRARYILPLPGESMNTARNRVAASSNKDILVYVDANTQAPERWADRLLAPFRSAEVAAVGPAIADMYETDSKGFGMAWTDAELSTAWLPRTGLSAYPVPLLPGVFLALRRSAFMVAGGFDEGMLGTGGEDLELCFRFWTAGFRCLVAPRLEILWMNPFTVGASRNNEHWGDLLYNLLRLATVHFGASRRRAFVAQVSSDPHFLAAHARLVNSDALHRRRDVAAWRKHSDKWFFNRF